MIDKKYIHDIIYTVALVIVLVRKPLQFNHSFILQREALMWSFIKNNPFFCFAVVCAVLYTTFKLASGDIDLTIDLEDETQVLVATVIYLLALLAFCAPFIYLFWKINERNRGGR